MIAYVLIYTFLATLMGAVVYVIGIPWTTPRPRKEGRRKSEQSITETHR